MLSKCMHGWQSGAGRQRVDANPLRGEEGIAANIQRIGSAFGLSILNGLDIFKRNRRGAELDDDEVSPLSHDADPVEAGERIDPVTPVAVPKRARSESSLIT